MNTQRSTLERQAVRKVIRTLKQNGFTIPKVWDGGELVKTPLEADILGTVFSVDESCLRVETKAGKAYSVLIVLGNHPSEVVADFDAPYDCPEFVCAMELAIDEIADIG